MLPQKKIGRGACIHSHVAEVEDVPLLAEADLFLKPSVLTTTQKQKKTCACFRMAYCAIGRVSCVCAAMYSVRQQQEEVLRMRSGNRGDETAPLQCSIIFLALLVLYYLLTKYLFFILARDACLVRDHGQDFGDELV